MEFSADALKPECRSCVAVQVLQYFDILLIYALIFLGYEDRLDLDAVEGLRVVDEGEGELEIILLSLFLQLVN